MTRGGGCFNASCMSLVRRSQTTFYCYYLANSRIASIHLLKQLYGMESAISSPHQSPAQACKKLWTVPWNNSAMSRRESMAQVKQSGNAKKILTKDSTIEIKNKYLFQHQLQNWISLNWCLRALGGYEISRAFQCCSLEQTAKQLIT